mmetsp:Transcript_37381/g.42073  ORF Transcript_37381/g.42073 Transcript_37381/m.42073 type:complete len:241 (+) Transcript_37381:145-867(+)
MVLGMVRTRVLERVLERVPGRRLLMDVIQIPNANITPAKVSVMATVVLDHHHHPVMLLLSAMDTTAARVIHHRLVNPLVGTVVLDQHHHLVKHATKSASIEEDSVVERVVKEERVEREDTMVASVDTDVSYSFMVMMMADLVDLVDLMIINSMADTTEADSEADSVLVTRNSVVTAERVDTEEKVEKEEKEERVDTMVDTKFVTSSVNWSPINKLYLSMKMRTLPIGHHIISSICVEHTM